MRPAFDIDILPQPDDTTCGPTCLHAVYRHYGDEMPLDTVIAEHERLEGGGTLAVLLGLHALRRGYRARIYTWNLEMFDPTWFRGDVDLSERLGAQLEAKGGARLAQATAGYQRFLELGGQIRNTDLEPTLLRRYLRRGTPILTGLSATALYATARERDENGRSIYDDVAGRPSGHFVVLSGYDPVLRQVRVADPYRANPVADGHRYDVSIRRLVASIYLGIVTYDANLLIVRPARAHDRAHRRR